MKCRHCFGRLVMIYSLMCFVGLDAATFPATQLSISVGYIWENPRFEEHNVKEVLVKQDRSDLRLICQLKPPLPKTKENFLARDSIVQWSKVSGVSRQKFFDIYWSDDQSITAIAFKRLMPRNLGNYSCSFLNAEQIIQVTAKDLDDVRSLEKPQTHADIEGLVLNLKNTSGLAKAVFLQSVQYEQINDERGLSVCRSQERKDHKTTQSVHSLKPEDIKMAAFIGGSIMAGVGANADSVLDLFKVAGDSIFRQKNEKRKQTFINMMKTFSPRMSVIRLPSQEGTDAYGISLDRIVAQINELIALVKENKNIDFYKDWKLVTLSLDFEDFCFACTSKNLVTKIGNVKAGLERLFNEMPRTFVNVILPPNIKLLTKYRQKTSCPQLYRKTCFCMELGRDSAAIVEKIVNEFRAHLIHLVEKTTRYTTKSDFSAVIQPTWSNNIVFKDTEIKKIFAKDCYHLSSYGHQLLGLSLWNNMFQPVFNKSKIWTADTPLQCPSKNSPYLFTNVNSVRIIGLESNKHEQITSSTSLRIGLGTFSGFLGVLLVVAFLLHKVRRRAAVGPSIRVLAQPWRRVKEKV